MTRTPLGVVLATGLLTLAGCSAAGATSGSAPASASLRVGLVEWRILTSGAAVTPGVDRFTVTNTGTTAHDLHVRGPGVHVHTPLLSPGATATVTVHSRADTTLTLTCEVPGHEAAGMRTTVAVAPREPAIPSRRPNPRSTGGRSY